MKVYITKKAKSPYRTDFYNELGKFVDLNILYEYENAYGRDISWSKKKAENHKEIFLKGFTFYKGHSISSGFKKYLRDSDAITIVGEYSTLTGAIIILYLKHKNKPFILNIDGGLIKRDSWIKFYIKKKLISSATYWLSPSESSDEYLIHYGAQKDNTFRYPFTSIMNRDILTYPLTQNEKKTLRRKLNLVQYERIVLTVGQFINRKGFDVLLKAHKNNNDKVALIIVGGTPTEEYLKIINENSIRNVFFIEFQEKSILANYFKAADLFVLPTREDIWGLVINEAMGYGLPVITTENCVAGVELIEDDKNGYIIPVDSVVELSNKMKDIISDEDLRKRMSLASLEKIRNYTNESMARRHVEILDNILKTRK